MFQAKKSMLEKESEFSQKLESSKKKTIESDERVKVSFLYSMLDIDSAYNCLITFILF